MRQQKREPLPYQGEDENHLQNVVFLTSTKTGILALFLTHACKISKQIKKNYSLKAVDSLRTVHEVLVFCFNLPF